MHTVKVTASIVILTLLIIVSGVFTIISLSSTSEKLDNHAERIESHARAGEWDMAEDELKTFKQNWGKTGDRWTMLLDHMEIDNIDSTLSRVSEYVKTKDKPSALAEIAVLRQFIKHIPDKESFNLKNIF